MSFPDFQHDDTFLSLIADPVQWEIQFYSFKVIWIFWLGFYQGIICKIPRIPHLFLITKNLKCSIKCGKQQPVVNGNRPSVLSRDFLKQITLNWKVLIWLLDQTDRLQGLQGIIGNRR